MKLIVEDIYKFIDDRYIEHIYLDVDGVIFASCQAMAELLNERYGTNANGSDVLSWNFKEIIPTITDEEIELLFEDPRFFELVKPIDGILDFMKHYRDRITIVTKARINNYKYKRIWFNNNGFKDIPIIALPLNVSKSIINMNLGESVFIDDSSYNLFDSNARYKICFYEYNDGKEREWQKDWEGLSMYSWKKGE